ncbi:DUF2235 domain-containing protein [Photobacterium leiognathi]|uniref:DUF2235 domain-containing protein n=1 Tax=Photobacterium leiognathi TaxID=553611 RepID=UPI002982161C|nr:DUF2235 domain-containing protein [Photobacterium leiognathi]
MNKIILLLALLSTFVTASCSSLISGSDPYPMGYVDRAIAQDTFDNMPAINIPKVVDLGKEETTAVYFFAFDGTNNDRDHFDQDKEQRTAVGYLSSVLEGNGYNVRYVQGPGVDDFSDSIFCHTCQTKAEGALEKLKADLEGTPSNITDVKIVVLGFSRGAAIARHFTNLVSHTWPSNSQTRVSTYSVLFDTVATSVTDKLLLGIAPTSEYLIHFVARDERRKTFPVVIDEDLAYKQKTLSRAPNIQTTPRFSQVELPGVHSDIGTSYKSGIGNYYRVLGESVLAYFGLIPFPNKQLSPDVFSEGVHDSRGLLSKLFGVESHVENPSVERDKIVQPSVPISSKRAKYLSARNEINFVEEYRSSLSVTALSPILFTLRKSNNSLEILSGEVTAPTVVESYSYEVVNDKRFINYTYLGYQEKSSLPIDDVVWESIPENKVVTLEYVVLKRNNERRTFILVDGVGVKKY